MMFRGTVEQPQPQQPQQMYLNHYHHLLPPSLPPPPPSPSSSSMQQQQEDEVAAAPLTPKIQNKRRSISLTTTTTTTTTAKDNVNSSSSSSSNINRSNHEIKIVQDNNYKNNYNSSTTGSSSTTNDDWKRIISTQLLQSPPPPPAPPLVASTTVSSPSTLSTTSSSSSSSFSGDSFDFQSLQRSLKRVRLTTGSTVTTGATSMLQQLPMTVVPISPLSTSSSTTTTTTTIIRNRSSLPGQLRLERDIQSAVMSHLWKPIIITNLHKNNHLTTTATTTCSNSNGTTSCPQNNNVWEVRLFNQRTRQRQQHTHSHQKKSNVDITVTYHGICNNDPTTIEMILRININTDHCTTTTTTTTNNNNNHHLINTNTIIQITIHIPRLYPHVPPIVYHIDHYYNIPNVTNTSTNTNHLYNTNTTTTATGSERMNYRSQPPPPPPRPPPLPPMSKILHDYHYHPSILSSSSSSSSSSSISPTTKHHQHSITNVNNANSSRHHSDRWIAGNYYKSSSVSSVPSFHMNNMSSSDTNLEDISSRSSSRNRIQCDDDDNDGTVVDTIYRIRTNQPLQEIIIVSNPHDCDDDDDDDDDESITTANDTKNVRQNNWNTNSNNDGIIYITKWTPIHRISDIIYWIVDAIIEPVVAVNDDDDDDDDDDAVLISTLDETSTSSTVEPHDDIIMMSLVAKNNHEDYDYGNRSNCINSSSTGSSSRICPNQCYNTSMFDDETKGVQYCKNDLHLNDPIQPHERYNNNKYINTTTTNPEYYHYHNHDHTIRDDVSNKTSMTTEKTRSSHVSSVHPYCDNNSDTGNSNMEHESMCTIESDANNSVSSFLHPNRFHVGYENDNINNSLHSVSSSAKSLSQTIATGTARLQQQQQQLQQRCIVNGGGSGYWNNRPVDNNINDNIIEDYCATKSVVQYNDYNTTANTVNEVSMSSLQLPITSATHGYMTTCTQHYNNNDNDDDMDVSFS